MFHTQWDQEFKEVIEFPKLDSKLWFELLANHKIPKAKQFEELLESASKILNNRDNTVSIQENDSTQIVVVGDLHGCFQAVIRLFQGQDKIQAVGFPGSVRFNKRIAYLFNGDLVDRGGSSIQVLIAICAFLVENSQYMYINRGNHETAFFLNEDGGCGTELLRRYGRDFRQNYMLDFYASLPIVHTYKDTIIAHGGVPKGFYKLSDLIPIDRNQQVFDDDAQETWDSFLWSYDRGEDVALFLARNKYKTLVCSHTASEYHNIHVFSPHEHYADFIGMALSEQGLMKLSQRQCESDHVHIVEIFSSPTNSGFLYVVVLGDGCPLKWEYCYLGHYSQFRGK